MSLSVETEVYFDKDRIVDLKNIIQQIRSACALQTSEVKKYV